MAIGECSAYSSLQADSKVKLGLRVGSHLALADIISEDPKWTVAYGFEQYMIDSTMNIIMCIIVIIIIIIIMLLTLTSLTSV